MLELKSQPAPALINASQLYPPINEPCVTNAAVALSLGSRAPPKGSLRASPCSQRALSQGIPLRRSLPGASGPQRGLHPSHASRYFIR